MTKIWLLSDLHQEFTRDAQAGSDPHTAFDPMLHAPGNFDVVVLAGDIDVPLTNSLHWIADRFAGVPVVAVAGNHDFYVDRADVFTMNEMRVRGRDLAGELGINLLDDSTVEIEGTRFIGGTLWTDFEHGPGYRFQREREAAGRSGMGDYRHIRRESTKQPGAKRVMRPEETIAAHQVTRSFIERELAVPYDGSTVVVTHHAPHTLSLDDFHPNLGWCYSSDLSSILESEHAPDAWLHGHIHRAVDYQVGRTRVASNPRGYQFTTMERHLGFDPGKVIEIGGYTPKPPGI